MKKIMTILILLASINCYGMNGNELFKLFESANKARAGYYVIGVIEGTSYSSFLNSMKTEKDKGNNNSVPYCSPKGATYQQSSDIVEKYLKENPSVRHQEASFLVYVALIDVWPCL